MREHCKVLDVSLAKGIDALFLGWMSGGEVPPIQSIIQSGHYN
jgi:hypothetical protein